MNYDLCDLLNRKLENLFSYMQENNQKEKKFKDQSFLASYLEKKYPDDFLVLIESNSENFESNAHWVYRNGKFSNNLIDFDNAAKSILREISNLTFSNNPCYDIMYFSGIIKMIHSNNVLYLETCVKPSLDQLLNLKDFEKNNSINNTYWKIVDRRNRNKFYEGKSLDKLFNFGWAKVK